MQNKTLPPAQRSSKGGGRFFPALCNFLGTLMILVVILTYLPITVPRWMGYEVYNVVSGSMEPAIPVGSVVYVARIQPAEVQDGDVIAFRSGMTVVTHRVVENRFVVGQFITKGDANVGEDFDAVNYADLIGRVDYHFPIVGSLMELYTSSVGKMYVLAFAACGVMFNILAGRLRDRQREKLRKRLEADMKRQTSDWQ